MLVQTLSCNTRVAMLKRAVHLHIHKNKLSLFFVMQTVEATAASQHFVYKAKLTSVEQYVPDIEGYVVLLPTILSVMYGQGEWPEESVSTLYGDCLACFLSVTLAGASLHMPCNAPAV